MPTRQKNKEKPSEVIRFIFRFAGAFVRLTFVRVNKKVPVLGILGKAIETAIRLQTKTNESACSLKTEHAADMLPQLSSEIGALHRKDESAAVAEKINTIKVEIDQLSQQICACSSQTQPGAIETAIQQNKG